MLESVTRIRLRLEKHVERKAVRYAGGYGIDVLKLNLRGRVGWPDRLYLFSMKRGGPVFIEFKRTDADAPSPSQARVHRRLKRLGYKIYVCSRLSEAKRIIDAAL